MDVAHHVEQGWPNSCVPACIGMVLLAWGRPFNESELHRGAAPGGHGLALAGRALGGSHRVLGPEELPVLDMHLASGGVVIAAICGPRYVSRLGTAPGGHPSRHGALCPPGGWGPPFHVFVVLARRVDGYAVLDPYYPGKGQPLLLSEDDFRYIFAAQAVLLAQRPPRSS